MEELLELMRSDDETERLDGAALLAEIVGSAFDADGAAIGESLRTLGGVESLCALLEERLRHSPASPLSQRSRSLTMPGAPEGASLLSAHNLVARLVEEAPLPDLIT